MQIESTGATYLSLLVLDTANRFCWRRPKRRCWKYTLFGDHSKYSYCRLWKKNPIKAVCIKLPGAVRLRKYLALAPSTCWIPMPTLCRDWFWKHIPFSRLWLCRIESEVVFHLEILKNVIFSCKRKLIKHMTKTPPHVHQSTNVGFCENFKDSFVLSLICMYRTNCLRWISIIPLL